MHILIIPTAPDEERIVADVYNAIGIAPIKAKHLYYPLVNGLLLAVEAAQHAGLIQHQPILLDMPKHPG